MTGAANIAVEPAAVVDRDAIRALLAASSLPIADLAATPIRFWVARHGERVIGTVGLERYGAAGLLTLAAGVKLLVVLTQTAQPIFARWGYAAVDRAYVPEDVKQSAEFTALCPASAVCLTKLLLGAGRSSRSVWASRFCEIRRQLT